MVGGNGHLESTSGVLLANYNKAVKTHLHHTLSIMLLNVYSNTGLVSYLLVFKSHSDWAILNILHKCLKTGTVDNLGGFTFVSINSVTLMCSNYSQCLTEIGVLTCKEFWKMYIFRYILTCKLASYVSLWYCFRLIRDPNSNMTVGYFTMKPGTLINSVVNKIPRSLWSNCIPLKIHTYTMSRTSIAPIVYPTDGKMEIGTARISFH